MVFDASGSMWAQMEDGRSRIEIAREVIAEFAETRDASVPIGVVAYGHNRRGDCGDIQTLLPIGEYGGGEFSDTLNALNPRGMTPLTDSLAMARDMIPPTAEAADLVLVTDGLENCDGDPCALARDIAAEGIDIRAHIVGFALSHDETATLNCVPEETGGQLFTTNSGSELSAALTQISEAQPALPAEIPVELRALDARDMRPVGGAEWRVVDNETGEEAFFGRERGIIDLELPSGAYTVTASTPSSEGEARFDLAADFEGPVDVELIKVLATLQLRAEDAETGDTVEGVEWTVMNLASEEAETFDTEAQVYPLHTDPGDYRIEAVSGDREGGVVVSADLDEDLDVNVPIGADAIPEVTLSAPESVSIGESFEIELSDAVSGYLVLVSPDRAEDDIVSRYQRMRNSISDDTIISRRAPEEAGMVEARLHWGDEALLIASALIEVVDADVTLDAPAEAEAGQDLIINLGGGVSGYVVIVEAGRPVGDTVSRYQRISNSVDGAGEITRTAPNETGEYEIRYYSNNEHRLLAQSPLQVIEIESEASLDASAEAEGG
ncbi:hypothetical protein [Fodinicurvata sp. EGI_FJ10296]|uniref:hypothetical protein n=1 Tax=Fodinicurvata sp. EGI_FJ10296 TaxID=3231908 RepID=UPI003456B061